MTQGLDKGLIPYPIYIIIVQKDRELSNKIAEILGVVHESPQLILVKDGKAMYDVSHVNIQVEDIPKV
jgi:bacillithiol system protein YtxJ